MEFEEKDEQKLDLFVLLEDFLRQAKRLWLLGLVMVLLCGAALPMVKSRSYSASYEAYASFTVRVGSSMYGSIGSYNERTAEVMASTFPAILTSDLLKTRAAEALGLEKLSGVSIRASSQASILTLTVKSSDPQRAYDVLNAVIDCYPEIAEFVVGSTDMVLLDESGVPEKPVSTFDFKGYAVKGACIGGVLWGVLVVVQILIKNTIHNEEELRRTLNTPCLGQVPSVKLTRRTPYPLIHRLKAADNGFGESIRLLRLRVEKAMEKEEKKVLLVSSAIPGEGKTTISVNLAVSLAKKGKRVLLIDCDLRNPSVVGTLSTKNHPLVHSNNLLDYMRGRITVMDMIQPTEVEDLFVIPGGTGTKADNTAMLSDVRMARLIQAGRNMYDYVILDTPPCSLLADAAEIAELAECGLMVIRQDYAARDQILDGIQRLGDGRLPVIGCAFNNVRKSLVSGGYSGYEYGYGRKK